MKKSKPSKPKKDPNVYPPGWDLKKTRAIAAYYDARKDVPLDDDPAIVEGTGAVWMEVPQDLVEEVRKLIARRRKSA